jgi:hypothetical protein
LNFKKFILSRNAIFQGGRTTGGSAGKKINFCPGPAFASVKEQPGF